MNDVSIIIVNYKYKLETLEKCLDSIKNSKEVTYEVIFVDNSPTEEVEGLVTKMDSVTYIPNKENLGFSKAVNQGMYAADGEFMLLLNGDVAFEEDVLARMLEKLQRDTHVGIASCIIKFPNGELQESIRRFPTPWNQLVVLSKLPHIYKPAAFKKYMAYDIDPEKSQEVESIMGAFMWIRKETMDQIGVLDEHFFLWFEEVDYCHRAYQEGIAIKHYGDVEVSHQKGASFSTVKTWQKQKWMRQSLRWYMKKHYGILAWLMFIVLQPFFLLTGVIAHALKRY